MPPPHVSRAQASAVRARSARFASIGSLVVALGGLGGACSDPTPSPPTPPPPTGECGVPYLGDRNAPMELQVRALKADGTDVPLTDGSDLALIFPPQGGRVAFVGVRATNLDPCAVQLLGALRDPRSKQVRVDARTVNLQRAADGYGVTGTGNTDVTSDVAIAAYSNVPVCPNQWSDESVFDAEYELEVKVTDHAGKRGGATIRVIPRCAEPARAAQCRCLCKKGYVLGEACGEDAGVLEGGSGG